MVFFPSKYTTPVARPLSSTSTRQTYELARISQRPVRSAMGITLGSVLDFAPTSHAYPQQNPQFTQAPRPARGCDRIAIGVGKGCHPSFFPARSKRTPEDFTGSMGIGYGFDRGGSNGLAPAKPDTPISHSTFV